MARHELAEGRSGRQLLRQEVTEGIKSYILENHLRPGDPLPTEAKLGEELDVSRSSVREAIKTLDALDIVEVRHGYGTYVGRLSLSAFVESLTFRGLLSMDDDVQVMSDLLEARELFERGLVPQLLRRADPEWLAELDALVGRMGECGAEDGTGFVEADRAFHAALIGASGNALVGQLSLAFWDVYMVVAPYLNMVSAEGERGIVDAHQRIVDAVRAGDAGELAAAISEHYAPLRQRLASSRARAIPAPRSGER